MNLDELLARPPRLHIDESGATVSWRVSDELLRWLDGELSARARTLETGAGISTILFALNGCRHTVVTPSEGEVKRILTWCDDHGVATDRIDAVFGRSEAQLPGLGSDPLDAVLIDGGHGFPTPFIDWFYAGLRVRVGGVLVIDDTQIWTGRVLRDYLIDDEGWMLERERKLDFAAFRRVAEHGVGEWNEQPYVLRRSTTAASPHLGRRAVARAVSSGRRFVVASQLLVRGELAALWRRRQP